MTVPENASPKTMATKTTKMRDAKGRFVKEDVSKGEKVSFSALENTKKEIKQTRKVEKPCAKAKSKKDAAAEVKAILKAATPDAARLLIQIMLDEEKPLGTRLDCANKIIERVCGKAGQNIDAGDNAVFKIVLSEEVKKYAE